MNGARVGVEQQDRASDAARARGVRSVPASIAAPAEDRVRAPRFFCCASYQRAISGGEGAVEEALPHQVRRPRGHAFLADEVFPRFEVLDGAAKVRPVRHRERPHAFRGAGPRTRGRRCRRATRRRGETGPPRPRRRPPRGPPPSRRATTRIAAGAGSPRGREGRSGPADTGRRGPGFQPSQAAAHDATPWWKTTVGAGRLPPGHLVDHLVRDRPPAPLDRSAHLRQAASASSAAGSTTPNLARRVVGDAEHGEVLDLGLHPVALDDPLPPRPGVERLRVPPASPTGRRRPRPRGRRG